jgi:aldose 1-epimerase
VSLRLVAGGWSLGLLPGLGGAIGHLSHEGRDVLRPSPHDADDPLQTACFPLVPYANRIADGRFSFGGSVARLPVEDRFAPHALHGTGWLRSWSVEASAPSWAVLSLDSVAGEGWPWAFRARQRFALSDAGLEIALSLENTGPDAAPAGLGLHPYFATGPEDRTRFAADAVWMPDTDLIPERLARAGEVFDFSSGSRRSDLPFIDHCYAGWDGRAEIGTRAGAIKMRADARLLHVYAPPGENVLCLEPVSHRPDAINAAPDEMAVIAPGDGLTLTMGIMLEP